MKATIYRITHQENDLFRKHELIISFDSNKSGILIAEIHKFAEESKENFIKRDRSIADIMKDQLDTILIDRWLGEDPLGIGAKIK